MEYEGCSVRMRTGIPLPEGVLHEMLGRSSSMRVVRVCHRLPRRSGCPKGRLDTVWGSLV